MSSLETCEVCGSLRFSVTVGGNLCPACDLPRAGEGTGPFHAAANIGTTELRFPAWEAENPPSPVTFLQTVATILTAPVQFFRSHSIGGNVLRAVAFSLLCQCIGGAFSLLTGFFVEEAVISFVEAKFGVPIRGAFPAFPFALSLAFVPLGAILSLLWTTGMFHILLRMVGIAGGAFGTTLSVVSYAKGACSLVQCIPVLGSLVVWFLETIYTAIALREVYRTSYSRVLLAVCIPLIGFMFLGALSFVAIALVMKGLPLSFPMRP